MSAQPRSTTTTPAVAAIAYTIMSERLAQLGVTIRHEPPRTGKSAHWDGDHRILAIHPDTHIAHKLWIAYDLHQLLTGPADHRSPSVPDPTLRLIRGGAST